MSSVDDQGEKRRGRRQWRIKNVEDQEELTIYNVGKPISN
jgi:hypothetical protein